MSCSLLLSEMETIICFNRAEDSATIYTADPVMMRKLDKLAESSEHYSIDAVRDGFIEGKLVSRYYLLDNKGLVSLRSAKRKSEMTEEQKEAARQRMKAIRAQSA